MSEFIRYIQRCAVAALLLLSAHANSQETPSISADPPVERIAGQTLEETTSQINDTNRTVRLRAVRSLAAFGSDAGPALIGALSHDDAAVRYVAAVQLGKLRAESLKEAVPKLEKLMHDDASAAVQMAAAFAVCRNGTNEEALNLLLNRVQLPNRAMACSACELVGMLGNQPESVKKVLQQVAEANRPNSSGDYHIGGAALNSLRQLESQESH